jgi:hypothetical protein
MAILLIIIICSRKGAAFRFANFQA